MYVLIGYNICKNQKEKEPQLHICFERPWQAMWEKLSESVSPYSQFKHRGDETLFSLSCEK